MTDPTESSAFVKLEEHIAEVNRFVCREIEAGIKRWIEAHHGTDFVATLEHTLRENARLRAELERPTIQIGKYGLSPAFSMGGGIWLEQTGGEGMQVLQPARIRELEAALDQFWKEHF